MKSIKLLLMTTATLLTADALTAAETTAKLQSATIFRRGAELVHTAQATLAAGSNSLFIDELAPNTIDINSMRIKTNNGVTVVSYEFMPDFIKERKSEKIEQTLQESIAAAEKELTAIEADQRVAAEMLELLRANQKIGSEQAGVAASELAKVLELYRKQLDEVERHRHRYNEQKTHIQKLRNELNKAQNESNVMTGRLALKLQSPVAGPCHITVSYYTPNAYWIPTYDIIGTTTQQPLKIIYKAEVVQNTRLDWKNVKLTLSTNMPSNGKVAPVCNAWFLNFGRHLVMNDLKKSKVVQNRISYAQVEEIAADIMYEEEEKSMSDYVVATENELDITYAIALPYDVSGNGAPQSLEIKNVEAPAKFRYYSVPRLDHGVFLLAGIVDWQQLNLLPGKANITFDGSYVGSSLIDPNSTRNELDITMGQDSRVVVKREKLKDYSSTKFLGNDKQQEFAFKTTVKNTRNVKCRVILKDQYPISNIKEIEIKVKETSNAYVNEEVGTLTWEFDLDPGEIREVLLKYTVKYPKNETVNLE